MHLEANVWRIYWHPLHPLPQHRPYDYDIDFLSRDLQHLGGAALIPVGSGDQDHGLAAACIVLSSSICLPPPYIDYPGS